jgi:LysR family hydrogen peroxide-inducible transcriptional activator
MYFKDLDYLIALAERGNFREAAEACRVSQPTLSVQLARLESELDALLIERGGRGAKLTPTGERAVPQAARVLQEVRALRAACTNAGGALEGAFHLGVIATAGPYLLPRILPAVGRSFPDAKLYLREDLTNDLVRRLLRGDLDAAILSLPVGDAAIMTAELCSEPFFAIVPLRHPLARRKEIGPVELASASMLLLEHGHCLRGQTTDYCHLHTRPSFDQATSIESLKQMVAAGLGCAVIPAMATQGRYARMAGIKVVGLKAPAPQRTLALCWRKGYTRSAGCRELAEVMRAGLRIETRTKKTGR